MLNEPLIAELKQESGGTRRVLERIPEDKVSWKPHPKSLSLGQLAYHVAVLPGEIARVVSNLTFEGGDLPRPEAKSVAELIAMLDKGVAIAAETLASFDDRAMAETWTLLFEGKPLLQIPRIAVIRTIMLNHWYHHRGQLMVYLRLLDVPVPAVYGPSADEMRIG